MEEDIHLLRHFVSRVYRWLRFCYLAAPPEERPPRWPIIQVHPALADLAVSAWKEFESQYPLDKLLAPLDPRREDLHDILFSHGLYGAQLRYKLTLVEMAAGNAASGFKGWKRKLIDLIDIVIDSLGPAGIAGALKELKDALNASVPDE